MSQPVIAHRKGCGLAILATILCSVVAAPTAAAFDHRHNAFTKQLSKFADPKGCVHYSLWKKQRAGLDAYLKSLCDVTPAEYGQFGSDERKAFWLNAYNAMAVALVLNNYPINEKAPSISNKPKREVNPRYPANSIRQIPDAWEAIKLTIAGREVSLYKIEHECLRRDFHDVRSQFAVVPATVSGAQLQRKAFTASNIDKELDQAAVRFMSRPDHLTVDQQAKTITVSYIFRWFTLDFLDQPLDPKKPPPSDDDIVRDYVQKFLPKELRSPGALKDYKIIYRDYDWTLNDCDR